MSLTTQSTGTDTTYLITFTRIGRNNAVPPLLARVRDADHLAEVIHAYARPHLGSLETAVVVDLQKGSGSILCGFQGAGSFTVIAEASPVQLLLAAADTVGRGEQRRHYERAAIEHERNDGVCPAGGNCWFEQQALAELTAGKPATR